jgi:hypothetical protein
MQLTDAASGARSDDIHTLRTRGIHYVIPEMWDGTFSSPLNPHGDKFLRGFNHTETARFLCPEHCLAEFDSNPEYFQLLYTGTSTDAI